MAANSELFEHLNFLIVVNNAEELEASNITAQLLRSNGCNRCRIHEQYLEEELPKDKDLRSWFLERFGLEDSINFIISEQCSFPFYEIAAFDFLIPVVTSEWVSTCISTNRHHRTSGFSSDERHVLKDLQVYVSRHAFSHSEYLLYTEMVHAMGGTCVDFLSSKTTHLVTQDSYDPAVRAVLGFGQVHSISFVFPTWIAESFKTLSVASLEEHLLDPENPPEVNSEKLQDLWDNVDELEFKRTSTTLEGHSFVIGMDVSLNKNLYATLIEFLQANGGTVIRHIDENDIRESKADCYIGGSVISKEYDAARDSDLELGNLIWIFYMWSLKQYVPSKSKLIFAPFKKKLFDTNELILSYSNYYGQQRFYIQRLAEFLGGFSTGELSRKNTHLVSQFPWGKKFQTAKRWEECTVVNHLWLEATYKCGKVLDPLEARFQQYPVKGGLKGTIGQIGLEGIVPQSSNPELSGDTSSKLVDKQSEVEEEEQEAPKIAAETNTSQGHPEDAFESSALQNAKSVSDLSITTDGNIQDPSLISAPTVKSPDAPSLLAEDPVPSIENEDRPIEQTKSRTVLERLNGREPASFEQNGTDDSEHSGDQYEAPVVEGCESKRLGVERPDEVETSEVTKNGSTPGLPTASSQLGKNLLTTPASHEETPSRSQTPLVSSLPSQTIHASGGRRAAKAKAARRLHSDIELLNEFQRNSKRKRTGDLLPEEIAQLERRKLLEQEADELLQRICVTDPQNTEEASRRKKAIYHMDAVCTGSHENIGDLDKILLEKLGVRVHEEITKENFPKLDTIIAPKQMRTAKFLKGFGFHPLKHALRPEFLSDLLKLIHDLQPIERLSLNLSEYSIPGVDIEYLFRMTSLSTKIFERAGLSSVNLVSDITGGVEVISSILKAHGIKEVKVVPTAHMNKLTIKDLILNEKSTDITHVVPDCVMIATKSSQVKHFKRLVKNECTAAMAVEWNWCISSIFQLNVNYSDMQNIIFSQDQNHSKRHSK